MDPKHIIVIGTSAGGLTALNELVSQLNPEWDAAYFIVLHLSRKAIGDFLTHRLQQHTALSCKGASENMTIEKGNIYIGIPNFHLIIKKGVSILGHGPAENRWRPSIDVLFRSAAAAYNSHVTGIILTGLMDDGTSGMWAIKRSGGTCIVQDPNEAEYPDMPLSVLNKIEVDHCVSLAEIGTVLKQLMETKVFKETEIPTDIVAEAKIAEKVATGIEVLEEVGETSVYTCPDCGGMLNELKEDKTSRYRCHTGHVYSERDLFLKQTENVESTLWVALRMMEERKNLLVRMEKETRQRGFARFANEHRQKGEDLQLHINKLKELLFLTQKNDDNVE